MSEFSSFLPVPGADRDGSEPEPGTESEAEPESSENLLPELMALEERLRELLELVRHLREENAALRERGAQLAGERDGLWRDRSQVSARLMQIIAKVDALRGET